MGQYNTTFLLTILLFLSPVFLVSFVVGSDVDCGYSGIDEVRCREIGCCWSSTITNSFPCRICTSGNFTQSLTCDFTNPSGRLGCGEEGVSKKECESLGCCFDSRLKSPPIKRCFHHLKDGNHPYCSYENGREREDCGWPGIHPDDCVAMECCSDFSRPGYHCYYRSGGNKTNSEECKFGNAKNRKQCGRQGIRQEECEAISCCYDDRTRTNVVAQCFGDATKPAVISILPSNKTVEEELSLTCWFNAGPFGKVTWEFDNHVVETNSSRNIVEGPGYLVVTDLRAKESTLSLFIRKLHRLDGTFKCKVSNEAGTAFQKIHVFVKDLQGWNPWLATSIVLFVVIFVLGVIYVYKRYLRTESGRRGIPLTAREDEGAF